MTLRQVCQLIIRRIAGGVPSDDFPVTENEVSLWVQHGMAASALKAYSESVNIDGFDAVPDGYYMTYKGLPLTLDTDTGYYYTTLPSKAYGLPRGYDIVSANVQGSGKLAKDMIRVTPQQWAYFRDLPKPKSALYFMVEKVTLWIDSFTELGGKKIQIRMATTDANLDEPIGMPEDQLDYVIAYVMKYMLPTLNVKQDLSNDAINVS